MKYNTVRAIADLQKRGKQRLEVNEADFEAIVCGQIETSKMLL